MEEQGKQGNAVRNVVVLVGCAFAALFVAMVVVMAVRGAPRAAWTYTMTTQSAPARSVAYYRSGSETPQLYAREAVGAPSERVSGLLPIRYYTGRSESDVVFSGITTFMGPAIAMDEAPIIYQWAGAHPVSLQVPAARAVLDPVPPLYVPAASVVLDDIDTREKRK